MAGIERLVPTKKLKTTHWRKIADSAESPKLFLHYDADFDALMLLIVPPETETIVHYIDEHVALLYAPDSREIVGMQIEDFERSFLQKHDKVRRVWRLSEAIELQDLGDVEEIMLVFETRKPEVVREVVEASQPALHRQGLDLKPVSA